jgi:hypothetical protein
MPDRKIKSLTFKDKNGYSRAKSLVMSKEEKVEAQNKQARANSFSGAQNKQISDTIKRNTSTPDASNLNDYGMYKGDQKYKKFGKKGMPKFRSN